MILLISFQQSPFRISISRLQQKPVVTKMSAVPELSTNITKSAQCTIEPLEEHTDAEQIIRSLVAFILIWKMYCVLFAQVYSSKYLLHPVHFATEMIGDVMYVCKRLKRSGFWRSLMSLINNRLFVFVMKDVRLHGGLLPHLHVEGYSNR